MKTGVISVAAVIAASFANASEDVDGSLAKLPKAERLAMESFLDFKLLDAGSARFRGVKLEGPMMVCGWINAKNAQGGYAGYRHFVARMQGDIFFIDGRGITLSGIDIFYDRSICIDDKGNPR